MSKMSLAAIALAIIYTKLHKGKMPTQRKVIRKSKKSRKSQAINIA